MPVIVHVITSDLFKFKLSRCYWARRMNLIVLMGLGSFSNILLISHRRLRVMASAKIL